MVWIKVNAEPGNTTPSRTKEQIGRIKLAKIKGKAVKDFPSLN
jgi:hypothetical protein